MTAALNAKSNGTQAALLVNGTEAFNFDATRVDSPVSIGASVAGNAMTLTLTKCGLRFRSTTLTSGTPTYVSTASDLSLTIPSGATLGTVNAVASRLVLLAINNSGTMELAVVNISGGTNLDETGVINTTAISAAASSASTIYSTTARTGVAYRVIGSIDSTQATAGTWASSPSLVQPLMGNAMDAMQSLGYGQTWQNVAGSRAFSTTYYNTTGKPILVAIQANGGGTLSITVGGVVAGYQTITAGNPAAIVLVPPGASYSATGPGTGQTWAELR